MLLSLKLSNLSVEGSAAFVLAIIFTILSVAAVIFFARHIQINKILLVIITLVLPFIAVFCWVYLLLDVLNFQPLINLGISIGAAVGYVLIALAIAYLIAFIVSRKKNEVVEEQTQETAEPILLEHTPEVVEEETAEEVVQEEAEEPAQEEQEEGEEENEEAEEGVVFSNEPRKTFAEQLETLNYETRSAYEEILAYAQAQAGTKTKEAKYQVTVSVGRMKLVLFKFIRGALVSSFMAGSSELKNYSAAEKAVKIKEKPVLIEVGEGDSVDVAKNMVDIVYKNITDAKQELKETKKAERKAKREAQKQEESQAEQTTAETETTENAEQPEEAPKKRRGRRKKAEVEEQPADQEEQPADQTEGE